MKAAFLWLLVAVTPLAAFSQSSLVFNNDANHLIVIDPIAASIKGVPSLGGQPAPQIGTPNDVMSFLTAQLFAGTAEDAAEGALTLRSTTTPAGRAGMPDGRLNNVLVFIPEPKIEKIYFRILIWETSAGSYTGAMSSGTNWYGATPLFWGLLGDFAANILSSFPSWSPEPILLSVNAAIQSPVKLSIQKIGADLQLSWPRGTLLEADDVTGPWSTNNATSPYTVGPAGTKKFYRVRVQ